MTTDDESPVYIGFRIIPRDCSINVGRLPGRKSYALYMMQSDGRCEPLAYFANEARARLAANMLEEVAKARLQPEQEAAAK